MNILSIDTTTVKVVKTKAEKEQAKLEKEQAKAEKAKAKLDKEQAKLDKEHAKLEKAQAKEQTKLEKEQAKLEKEQAKVSASSLPEDLDQHIKLLLDRYVENLQITQAINKTIPDKKKIRGENFPSHISENLVKLALNKFKYHDSAQKVTWNTNVGDLAYGSDKIEVKGFTSEGPSSFGPAEDWSELYFIDATDIINKQVTIYCVSHSNTDPVWSNLKMNKTQTYNDMCLQGKRPRMSFANICAQVPIDYITTLFEGHTNTLFE